MALQLQVKTLKGKTIKISASSAETAASLLERLATPGATAQSADLCLLAVSQDDQLSPLDDSMTLSASGVADGHVLFLRQRHHAGYTGFEVMYQPTDPPFGTPLVQPTPPIAAS
eukprot:TRINITY_DN65790_c0_g1_i1.p1 TRINITY_DN65790_c0_g1~~TRINITY_DN65790_c0_g1_i1.p1  ORF type:complete len:125 (-),score=17.26 TRINITY_DN65790_c0_g1_i1:89-430(-)